QLYIVDLLSATRPLSAYVELAILRLPCKESWKAPLFVGGNASFDHSRMSLGEEIGIQREWYERFGAELCCVGKRSWQFYVARPPRDHREAVGLLRQHYLYSWVDDTYDKETIENSAAAIRVDTYWHFMWS